MISWFKSIFGSVTGAEAAFWRKIISVIKATYSFLDKEISAVIGAEWRYAIAFGHSIDVLHQLIVGSFDWWRHWISSEFDGFRHWVAATTDSIGHGVAGLFKWTNQQLGVIRHAVAALYNELTKWVVTNIWNPLYTSIKGILDWINTKGNFMYSLLTNPAALVDMLLAFIWQGWLALFKKFLTPLIRYILANWKSAVPDIMAIIENLLHNVL